MTKVEMINKLIEMGYTSSKYSSSLWKKDKKEIERIYKERKKTMFETRGLGAGSYPEKPESRIKNYKVKVTCYATCDLMLSCKEDEIEETIRNKDYFIDGIDKIEDIEIVDYEEE